MKERCGERWGEAASKELCTYVPTIRKMVFIAAIPSIEFYYMYFDDGETVLRVVSRSQTVTLTVTVWTTAVERFVLSSPGSRVGDKCEQYRKGHESHYLMAKVLG